MSKEIREALAAPFTEEEIEWRVGQCGTDRSGKPWARVFAYVQARAIMDRLDDVVGVDGWEVKYRIEGTGFICSLAVCLPALRTKEDGADPTDMEPFKGGISSALKRAASAFGIGRYLYKIESSWAQIVEKSDKANYAKTKDGVPFYWVPPKLPDWALPVKKEEPPPQTKDQYKSPEKKTLAQEMKTTLDTVDYQKRVIDAILGTAEKKTPIAQSKSPDSQEQKKISPQPSITNLKKDSTGSAETRKPHCLLCGMELALGPFGYYCKNRNDKKGKHTSFKEEDLDSFFFNNDPGNLDAP